jgi:hypothetical protein
MSHKQKPRLGSAIASTILSLFSGVLLVGVDKAQAATLTYDFGTGGGSGFFKVNNSSLTGIGYEEIAVSEGRFNGVILNLPYMTGGKEFYDLAGRARALFYQGDFIGLQAGDSESGTSKVTFPPDEDGVSRSWHFTGIADWSISTENIRRPSWFSGVRDILIGYSSDGGEASGYRRYERDFYGSDVSYTLVNTEPEPVPEPLTAGGTALALAGLSWLKHKKKMAA